MREKDIGELHTMIGLHLLDREGEGAKQTVKEKDAGMRGEFRADPGRLKASTIINGRIKILLKRLGAVPEAQRGQDTSRPLELAGLEPAWRSSEAASEAGSGVSLPDLPVAAPDRQQRR